MSNDLIKILLEAKVSNSSIQNIKGQLNKLQTETKPISIKINSTGAVKSIKDVEGGMTKINATNTKTWENAKGEVIKYTNTLKSLEKGLTVIDTYMKNAKGGFDFSGRTVNDKSIEMTYKNIQKAHGEALKLNKVFDDTIAKNHQMAKDAAWKQYFQGISKTSDKIVELNQHYKSLEDNRPMDSIQAEALKLNKVFDEQAAKAKTLKGTFAELSGEQATGLNVAKKLSKIYGDLEIRGYSLDKVTGRYNVQLKQSSKENLNLAGTLKQVNGALSVQSEKITQARNVQLGFWDQMKIALERVPIWMGATTVYFQSARFIKGTIDEIKDLNKEMIDLEKVSTATMPELQSFFESSPQMARELGVLTTEVINTTAAISKLGYSLEDSEYLTRLGLIGKTVGDLENTSDSVDYLTSAIKGFRMETQQADEVLDYMNHTANTTSIDFAGIGEGYKRMSAAMSEANNSIEESTGLLVAGYDIVRNSEQVATALRTTSLRIRGVSEDGEKLGGLIPKLESDFNKFGLSLKKDNDTFKSTFEILKDIASIQDNITDMEQADLLEALAGKRNAQTIAAIIQNMDTAIEVSESFAESQGSALIEHAKYMKGVEAAQNNVSAAMTELHTQLLNDDTIISVLNLTTSLIDNISALGKWNYAVVLATGSLLFFISTTKKMIIANEAMKISSIGGAFKSIAVNIIPATKAMFGMKSAMDATTVSANMLNIATAGIVLAIGGIALATGAFIKHQKRQREEMEKSLEVFQRQQDVDRALDGLIKSYEDLGNKTNKTAKEQQSLLEIKEKIKELLPQSASLLDDETTSIENQATALKKLSDEELRQAKIRAAESITEYGKKYERASDNVEAHTKSLEKLRKTQSGLIQKIADGSATKDEIERFESLTRTIELHEDGLKKNKIVVDTVDGAYEILNGTIGDNATAIDDNATDAEGLTESQRDLNTIISENNKLFNDTTSKLQDYNVILSELNSKEGLSAQSKQDIIQKHAELLPYLSDEQELRKQLIKIISEEEEVQRRAYINMLMDSEDFFNAKISGNGTLVDKLGEFYNKDLENAKSLADAKKKVEEILMANLSKQWAKYYDAQSNSYKFTEEQWNNMSSGQRKEWMDYREQSLSASKRFEGIVLDLGGVSFKDINMSDVKDKKDKKDKKEEYKAEADAYAKINLELDRNNVLLQLNKTYQDQAGDDIAKKIKLMDKEIELNEERQDLLSQYNTQMRTEAKSLQKDLAGIFKFEGSWDDNSMTITNMDAIAGKSEAIDKKFKRIVEIMGELPKGSQAWLELNNEIQKIELDKLITEFKLADKAFEDITETISDLEYELKMLEPDDFNGKVDNNVKTLAKLKEEVEDTTRQLEELGENGFEAGTKKSDAFIARQVELIARLKEGKLAAKEYERSLVDLIRSQTRETIEAEKRNAYMDLDLRQRRANEQFKADRERMDADISRKQSRIDGIQAEIDRIQESERARQESLDRSKRLEEISKLQNKYYHLQYVNLSNITEEQAKLVGLEKEREQYLERQTKLQELQLKLTNLQNEKNIQQLTKKSDGTWDFEYVADQKAIDDVNKQVEDLQKEHEKTIKDLKEQTLSDLKKAQESYDEWERQNDIRRQIEAKQRRIQKYQDEIKDLQDNFAEKERITNEEFAKEKQALDDYYTDIDLLTQEKLDELKETFDGKWTEIAGAISAQFGEITSAYEEMVNIVSKDFDMGMPRGGGSSDSSSSGGSSAGSSNSSKSSSSGSTIGSGIGSIIGGAFGGGTGSIIGGAIGGILGNIKKYHEGGIIGDSEEDLPEMTNQLFNLKPNEQIVKALKGELMIPEENISKNFIPNMQELVNSLVLPMANIAVPKIPKIALSGASGGNIVQQVTVKEMIFPNVRDAKEIEDSVKNLSTYANQWASRK